MAFLDENGLAELWGIIKEWGLTDETKALYGMDENGTPADAFKRIAQLYGAYGFDITLVTSDGFPIPNMELNGLYNAARTGVAVTDENGKCFAISETPEVTVSIVPNIIGLTNLTTTLKASDTALVASITITMPVDTSLQLIRTSGAYTVLADHPVDLCLVGAGASGYSVGSGTKYGDGGGGGYAENILGEVFPDSENEILLTVGSGGAVVSGAHSPGGDSTLVYNEKSLTAGGAPGKEGNGNGGTGNGGGWNSAANGSDGQVRVFNDETLPLPGGGGGGGGYGYQFNGGKDFGGIGGRQGIPAGAGSGPGGGGGGCSMYIWQDSQGFDRQAGVGGAKGGDGGLYIRVSEVSA